MNDPATIQIEYVEARRVLLNALDALRPHQNAIVLIGAQAVYLRTVGRLLTYQPFTTDADLVVDPTKLLTTPPLDQSMRDAGRRDCPVISVRTRPASASESRVRLWISDRSKSLP